MYGLKSCLRASLDKALNCLHAMSSEIEKQCMLRSVQQKSDRGDLEAVLASLAAVMPYSLKSPALTVSTHRS